MKQRILSALCLLPLPVLAIYFGSPWFEILVAVILTIMAWEWEKMVLNRFSVLGMAIAVTGVVCVFLLDLKPCVAWILPIVTTLVLFFVVKKEKTGHEKLFAFGVPYSVYPVMALVYFRQDFGFLATVWLLVTVWAMDSGAYFFGKAIGGPKMAPKISPKKTWAGLFGGIFLSSVWGFALAYFLKMPAVLEIATVSAVLGGVSQMGDLAESAIKRYLGVKDSSNLIPGHGGVYDRIDAILLLAPIALLLTLFVPALNFWG